jgi:hypothetical protein
MPENRSGYVRWMLVAAVVVLSGCTNPFVGDAPTFDEILAAGWLEDKTSAVIVPLYCYDTIGAPDCDAAPVPGESGRLRGYEGPAPKLRVEP